MTQFFNRVKNMTRTRSKVPLKLESTPVLPTVTVAEDDPELVEALAIEAEVNYKVSDTPPDEFIRPELVSVLDPEELDSNKVVDKPKQTKRSK